MSVGMTVTCCKKRRDRVSTLSITQTNCCLTGALSLEKGE